MKTLAPLVLSVVLFFSLGLAHGADALCRKVELSFSDTLYPEVEVKLGSEFCEALKYKENYLVICTDLNTVAYSVTAEAKNIVIPHTAPPALRGLSAQVDGVGQTQWGILPLNGTMPPSSEKRSLSDEVAQLIVAITRIEGLVNNCTAIHDTSYRMVSLSSARTLAEREREATYKQEGKPLWGAWEKDLGKVKTEVQKDIATIYKANIKDLDKLLKAETAKAAKAEAAEAALKAAEEAREEAATALKAAVGTETTAALTAALDRAHATSTAARIAAAEAQKQALSREDLELFRELVSTYTEQRKLLPATKEEYQAMLFTTLEQTAELGTLLETQQGTVTIHSGNAAGDEVLVTVKITPVKPQEGLAAVSLEYRFRTEGGWIVSGYPMVAFSTLVDNTYFLRQDNTIGRRRDNFRIALTPMAMFWRRTPTAGDTWTHAYSLGLAADNDLTVYVSPWTYFRGREKQWVFSVGGVFGQVDTLSPVWNIGDTFVQSGAVPTVKKMQARAYVGIGYNW